MRIDVPIKFTKNIPADKLQETYEALLIVKKAASDDDEESMLNLFIEKIKEKLEYLKYRQIEIDDRLRQEQEAKEIKENERDHLSGTKS